MVKILFSLVIGLSCLNFGCSVCVLKLSLFSRIGVVNVVSMVVIVIGVNSVSVLFIVRCSMWLGSVLENSVLWV